jgi:hypothetical protein
MSWFQREVQKSYDAVKAVEKEKEDMQLQHINTSNTLKHKRQHTHTNQHQIHTFTSPWQARVILTLLLCRDASRCSGSAAEGVR